MKAIELTKAEQIYDALQHRRLLDAVPPVVHDEAQAARNVADFIFTAMGLGGLRLQDATVALVCLDKNGKGVLPGAFDPEHLDVSQLKIIGEIASKGLQPVGVLFVILDREQNPGRMMWGSEVFEGAEYSRDLMAAAFKVLEARHKEVKPLVN